ncbi:4Fe-4S dicluster domain-containing protein [Calorimonas adulescens]|uniref:4Fe-4S dicluster domain-containing protein n=2 Tax=Calorimonas adulescens TaxID=2606906 RepID=A0A5D8QA14_9THEO|nr:4Fe-4S dicluster domain-containing protein [Calorimonas adulescens]
MTLHSIVLNEEKCKGCTNCIKRCPTEAIRVRNGKARIIENRCIDCGECIRICPNHAKEALMTNIDDIYGYKYKVALPAPSLYGQFKEPPESILGALKNIGFDYILEVAYAAEITSYCISKYLKENNIKRPAISSSCPSLVRLIMLEFPGLIANIIRVESPMEIAARIVKRNLSKELAVNENEIGVFFISPCAAKMTAVKNPIGTKKSYVDGVISIKDIAPKILKHSKDIKVELTSSSLGIGWAISGGESRSAKIENALYVDGIHNCIQVLREIERGKLNDIEFFEGLACPGGCIGGPLTIENLYVAKNRIKKIMDSLPSSPKPFDTADVNNLDSYMMDEEIYSTSGLTLDKDLNTAIKKLTLIDKIEPTLPGLDCGACGAPTCKALAEDIAMGWASEMDCIFILKNKISSLAKEVADISSKLPPTIQYEGRNKNEGK